MSGYVFVGNGRKLTAEKFNSREPVVPSNFSIPCIEAALKLGYEVYLGTNRNSPEGLECTYPVNLYDAHTYSSITAFSDNRIAYKNLSEIVKKGAVDVIHCNTPIGGMIGRLVGKRYKVKKVIYTVHGFHFYKGAPLFNRTVLKWAEQVMAHWTDAIITINKEDYEAAKKFKLKKNGKVFFVHGVGITLSEFQNPCNRAEKRAELGLSETDIALISMGDLIERNNYDTAIRAIAEANNPALQYFICGKGSEEENLKELAESLGVSEHIHFLGFRSDIKELLTAVDVFLFTTKQEGLPKSMMEAMASGLPCIASKIQGNTDLLEGTQGGYLYQTTDVSAYAEKLKILANDKSLREKMGRNNLITIQKFSTETVNEEIRKIYESELSKIGEGITLNEYIQNLLDFFPAWAKKRVELDIPLDAFLLISVGELNTNKNNGIIISAMEKLRDPHLHYILCGVGEKQIELQEQADKAGLHDNVHFLGYRSDVNELYETADCFVMPSFREGLSRSIMEAMASGLPCIASKIRGNVDLLDEGVGGFLCDCSDADSFAERIKQLAQDSSLRQQMSTHNLEAIKAYDVDVVREEILSVYKEVLRGENGAI